MNAVYISFHADENGITGNVIKSQTPSYESQKNWRLKKLLETAFKNSS